MYLIIAGSRGFTDHRMIHNECDVWVNRHGEPSVVITGGARGPDTEGKNWAIARGFPNVVFAALWDDMGNRAGYLRNKQMALAGTHLLAFWDKVSRGTGHMIGLGLRHGLVVDLVFPSGERELDYV